MPADFIIRTMDMLHIIMVPPVLVLTAVGPMPLVGTSPTVKVIHMPVCLLGDELPPFLRGPQLYTSPPFVTPGVGTFSIHLLPNNMTLRTKSNGKSILIKGGVFPVSFNVMAPAMQLTPTGPISDPVPVKQGNAQFITTNLMVKAG